MPDKPMRLLEHLEELRVRLLRVLWVTLPIFLFIITFEVHFTWWNGIPLPVGLGFDPFSALSSQIFRFLVKQLVPNYIAPTQLSPAQALSVQFKISGFLTLVLGMPIIAYEAWMFIAPALYHREKKLIAKVVVPATILFIAGAIFAYLVILPFTFSWLYGLGAGLGARLYILSLDDFLDIVLIVMAAMGLAFQTPLIMWGLTSFGLVRPIQWRRWWRYAVIAFFVFGAVVTPDGSGVTMILVALPMTVLYFAGMGLAGSFAREAGAPRIHRPRKVVAASLAIIVVLGALGYFYLAPHPPAPERVNTTLLREGKAVLELPVMTTYGLALPKGYNSSATVTFSSNFSVVFRWENTTLNGVRVVFVPEFGRTSFLAPEPGGDAFRVYPHNREWTAVSMEGPGFWTTLHWVVMGVHYNVTSRERVAGDRIVDRWIELKYSLTPMGGRSRELPAANVSLPGASDLVPAGFRVVDLRGKTDLVLGLGEVPDRTRVFGLEIPGPYLELASRGTVATHLRSSFRWGTGDGYTVRVTGSGDYHGVIALFWDTRFGSFYPQAL